MSRQWLFLLYLLAKQRNETSKNKHDDPIQIADNVNQNRDDLIDSNEGESDYNPMGYRPIWVDEEVPFSDFLAETIEQLQLEYLLNANTNFGKVEGIGDVRQDLSGLYREDHNNWPLIVENRRSNAHRALG